MSHVNAVAFTILVVLFVIVTLCGFAVAVSYGGQTAPAAHRPAHAT